MFSSLSRGSSRVRQAYICSSCLSNALTHIPPAPLLAADRGQRAVFYSTSTEAYPNNDAGQLLDTPKPTSTENETSAVVAECAEKQQWKTGKRPKRVTRISSSSQALRKLRESLAHAAKDDGVVLEDERSITQKPKGAATLRKRRSKKGKIIEETAKDDAIDFSTQPIPQLAKEDTPAARLLSQLIEARSRRSNSIDSTNTQGTDPSLSQGKETSQEGKKDTETSKTKENAPGSNNTPEPSKEFEPERAAPFARRGIRRHPPLDLRRIRNPDPKPRVELEQLDSALPSADAAGSQDRNMKGATPDPYTLAVPEFLKKYPGIAAKVFHYKRDNSPPKTASLRSTMSFRKAFISLIQRGDLAPDERQVTMKLLRRSLSVKPVIRSRKHEPSLPTMRKRSPGVAGPDEQRRVRGPTAGTSWGRNSNSKIEKARATPGPISSRRGTTKHEIKTIEASELQLIPIDKEPLEVPSLAYGLERVLFNPGVYHLQDPRSRVFNFDPYLQTIMPVSEFDFNALKKYITSSRDKTLLSKAKEEEKKYTGSTSSMTSALGHFHFLLSQWRPITTGNLSQMFPVEFNSFTALQRGPVAVFLRYKDGTYAIDADKEYDDSNILMMLGKSMEKLLTLSTDEFEKYRKANSDQISEEQRNESEPFHYTTMGDFLLRSQLDAHDSRLPGTGMFDLKTRAVISVRMDTKAFEEGRGYQIRGRHGEWESFEREYYDMIRSAFLKYSLQVRMGRMDGIFVAFHNTERIFGFQYISLPEMDYALHGTDNVAIGDSEFKLSLELLNRVLDRATAKFPKKSLRLHFETRDGVTPFMYIFAEPIAENKIESIQATNKRKIEQFEREVLGVASSSLTEEQKEVEWAKLRAKVEEKMQNDELGLENAEQAKSQAELDEMAIQERMKADEIFASTAIEEDGEENEDGDEEDEDALIEELDDDDERLEEEESYDEENLEAEENDEENEERSLEDSDLDEHDTAEELLSDDLENTEEEENLEEQDVGENDRAEMDLSDELEQMEEEYSDDQNPREENVAEDLDEHEESKSLQEQDPDQPLTTEEADAENLRTANILGNSAEDEETPVDESQPDMKKTISSLTSEGILSGPTVKEAVIEEANKREAIVRAERAAERKRQKGNWEKSTETTQATKRAKPNGPEGELQPLLAMTLVIRNKVNGKYVERPNELEGHEKWEVEYALSEVPQLESAHRLYAMTKERRFRALNRSVDVGAKNAWNNHFIASIKKMSEKGRVWRDKQDKIEKQLPVKTLEVNEGKTMSSKDKELWGQGKEE